MHPLAMPMNSVIAQYWVFSRDGLKFGRRIWPNVRLGEAWRHVTIRPNFGKNLASLASLQLRCFALSADINLKSLYLLLITTIIS